MGGILASKWLDFATLSLGAQFIRVLKYILIVSSIVGIVSSWSKASADWQAVGAGALELWRFVEIHAAPISVALATVVAMLVDWWASRHGILTTYEEDSIVRDFGGANIFEELQKSYATREARLTRFNLEAGVDNPRLNSALVRASVDGAVLPFRDLGTKWLAYKASDSDAKSRPNLKKRYAIQRKIRKGARITNDKKLRLCADPEPTLKTVVQIQQTDYISSLMTDQLAFRHICSRTDDDDVLHDGVSDFLSTSSQGSLLMSLAQATGVSNQLGASTLAFTTDGIIPLVKQTPRNAQAAGKLAPSGSGSLDWADLRGAQSGNLLDVARYGAARELIEECGLEGRLNAEEFARTNVLVYGFARMVHRAGKPEFFCIAALPWTSAEINSFKVSKLEREFTDKTVPALLPAVDWSQDVRQQIADACKVYAEPAVLASAGTSKYKLRLSYALHHALVMLSDLCSEDEEAGEMIATMLLDRLRPTTSIDLEPVAAAPGT